MAAQGAAAPRGACIVRTDVQHQLAPLAATSKASFNLRTAAIVPDLLVTCNGRTLPFVVALQGAGKTANAGLAMHMQSHTRKGILLRSCMHALCQRTLTTCAKFFTGAFTAAFKSLGCVQGTSPHCVVSCLNCCS